MNHTIKFLEGFLVDKLKEYLNKKRIKDSQLGSKKNIGINETKIRVLGELIQLKDMYKEKKQPHHSKLPSIIFIDFKNVSNSVVWTKLFKIIEDEQILNETEAQILKFIYTNSFISNGKGRCITIKKRIPQGMSTSPILF